MVYVLMPEGSKAAMFEYLKEATPPDPETWGESTEAQQGLAAALGAIGG